ncbi:DUF2179 domain-containing protein [Dokdonia sp. Hel_I_53]|uniref:DUF2179 domain-containing protein n=1 Tax=Dokdonia sp. Hel_I_53 TaxID=1566287 RepID=UPI0021BD18BC|nr:DUF2179 domain-containing protein [Dokdonia sp. Hel_I_53]
MTVYKAAAGYGSTGQNKERRVIQTVINRIHLRKIHRIIDAIDANSFIVEFDVNNVKGGVLRRYLEKHLRSWPVYKCFLLESVFLRFRESANL